MGPYLISINRKPFRKITIRDQHYSEIYFAKQCFSFIKNALVIKDVNDNKVATVTRMISFVVPIYKI